MRRNVLSLAAFVFMAMAVWDCARGHHGRLSAAQLLDNPFTRGQIGVLMRKGQDDLMDVVNATVRQMKADGSLEALHEKYGLKYSF